MLFLVYLLIQTNCIQTLVHNVNPTILGGEHEQGHEGLPQVVEVVLVIDPAVSVAAQLKALGFVLNELGVGTLAVVEDALEQLQRTDQDSVIM